MTKNVMTDFGAVGDNVHDDGPNIQNALNTGDDVYLPTPPVKYKILNALSTTRPGQRMFGDHRLRSMLSVSTGFLNSVGVIIASPSDPGPVLQDFGISFAQPDTNVRANLTVYPPAIYAQNSPRLWVERLYVERATVGIDLGAHSGDSTVRAFECSAFNKHVFIDDAFDTMRLDNVSLAAWGVTPNQQQILYDPATVGLYVGRCDDLKITSSLVAVGTGLHAFRATNGAVGGEIVNSGFEIGGIMMDAGYLTISGSYFAVAAGSYQAIKQIGGDITLSGCRMNSSGVNTLPMVDVSGASGFAWAGGTVFTSTQDRSVVKSQDPGNVINLSAITVFRDPGVAYLQPTFWKVSGTANIIGTAAGRGFGTGSCTVIRIDTDNQDCVLGNSTFGGRVVVPSPATIGVYGPNSH